MIKLQNWNSPDLTGFLIGFYPPINNRQGLVEHIFEYFRLIIITKKTLFATNLTIQLFFCYLEKLPDFSRIGGLRCCFIKKLLLGLEVEADWTLSCVRSSAFNSNSNFMHTQNLFYIYKGVDIIWLWWWRRQRLQRRHSD